MDVKEAVRTVRPHLDALDVEDFPGCVAVPMTEAELEEYEGRLEYWAADTQTAMVVAEPTTTYHEIPSHRVTGLVREIGLARGSEILALGSVDLVQFTDEGGRNVLLQADAVFFLNRPWPKEKAVDVDAGPAPDVLLEVDHTTDVRRGKLSVYASLGLPEVWVEVPQPEWLAPRESGWPRLTIYLLEGGRYVESARSRAFAGWTAAEIHRALNEEVRSPETVAALRRVGRRLGRAMGTGPDDDLFLAAEREESREQGRQEGREEGRQLGRLDATRLMVRQTLAARAIPVSEEIDAWLAGLSADTDTASLVEAAVECRDAEDFLCRVQKSGH